MSNPILDLTYRNYDGPLESRLWTWWSIAKMSMRLGIKKKFFWFWVSASGFYYFILSAVFYFVDSAQQSLAQNPLAAANPEASVPILFRNIVWKDQFLNALGISQMYLLILAILLGAGAIAGDNKANALLVYLSKPCTKLDYLIGKWVGLFIPLTLITLGPALLFYGYCALSFQRYGFLSQDPALFLRILAVSPVAAAFHASLILGVSSLTNQGRIAGTIYAGLYFLTNFFTQAIVVARVQSPGRADNPLLTNLFYASVDGVIQAVYKLIFNTRGSSLVNGAVRVQPPDVPSPVYIFIYFGLMAAFLALAWSRIRAVEVVG